MHGSYNGTRTKADRGRDQQGDQTGLALQYILRDLDARSVTEVGGEWETQIM